MVTNLDESASELLEVVPIVMRDIRYEMRSRRSPELTVTQFRTLLFVNRNKDSSLFEVANHMGLTPPSTSRLVDTLISRGYMRREEHPADRRRVKLAVTGRGLAVLEACRKGTLSHLSSKLSCLAAGDRDIIVRAMQILRSVFVASTEKKTLLK
jgi:MarR family transcriptional regulator for hemolysin